MILTAATGRNRLLAMRRAADYAGLDERSVVTLAIIGDERAFEQLVQRREAWLRNLLRRLSGDPHLADDLAQQVFLQAWRSIKTLRSSGAFAAWIKRMAVNAWLQYVRSNEPLNAASSTSGNASLRDGAVAESTGVGIDIDRALNLLPAHVRLCIVLAYNEGMSHREIAEVTALPLGTVKSHIKRGNARLQQFLAAYEAGRSHDTASTP